MEPREYKAGDTIWFVAGLTLVIRCVIREVDDWARKKHPDGYLFYDIDEPVGHDLDLEEMYDTKEEAIQVMLDSYKEILEETLKDGEFIEEFHRDFPTNLTLEEWRDRKAKFISKSWEHDSWEERNSHIKEILDNCPTKVRGVDWFNYEDATR